MTSSSPSVLRGSARSRQLDQALLPDDDGVVERMTVVVHDGQGWTGHRAYRAMPGGPAGILGRAGSIKAH